ncbi:uncharacterized protein LOC129599850 [Paramacrobiotus metropolitanus]|uniref:uncharacterized protein LOC129599850 n=1 Tax=Paramacrobiotus metropolitanus TaxID=2943436 RepID=UPI0024457170|nr:uncharacterized protein LOC129599850 [Paramacrobiotus metropolitanus]
MDDSAIQNVQKALHFKRSRSYGDFSTFDPAFDDVMRKAVEKSAYAKPFKRLIRRLALVSFARILLIWIVLAAEYMHAQPGDKRENQEREHQEQSSQRPFLLEYLPTAITAWTTFACAGFGNAGLLWYNARKMRGKWFLSAAKIENNMSMSVGWWESESLLWNLGLNLLLAMLATVSMVTVVGIVELHFPGLFISLWWHVVHVLWHHYTVHVPPRYELLLAMLPCGGFEVIKLITVWQCRRAMLRFQKICAADAPKENAFDWSIIVEGLYYSVLAVVHWLVIWVGHALVLLRRKPFTHSFIHLFMYQKRTTR